MREYDIRPADILGKYLELSRLDAQKFFPDPDALPTGDCPGCGAAGRESSELFVKHGFRIVECDRCSTIFVNPRPASRQLEDFYRDSPSTEYWANTFFPSVAEVRRQMIFAPRAAGVLDLVRSHDRAPDIVVDVGAGYGLFLQELGKIHPSAELRAIEPGEALAQRCRDIGLTTFEGYAEDAVEDESWNGIADLVTSFEVVEHLPEPVDFFRTMKRLARPGGFVFFSGLCGDGFDIRTLGEVSNAISPPHHLTFLSQAGVRQALLRAGLKLIGFQTPGKLDVDIVSNALKEKPHLLEDSPLKSVLLGTDDGAREKLQAQLVEQCRSSHMWVLAQNPAKAVSDT